MSRTHRRDRCIYIVIIVKEILARVLFADNIVLVNLQIIIITTN